MNRTRMAAATVLTAAALLSSGAAAYADEGSSDVVSPDDTAALKANHITLDPSESDASVVILSSPGDTVDVTYRPDGCESDDCEQVVQAETPPAQPVGDPAAKVALRAPRHRRPKVRALHGATVVKVTTAKTATLTTRAYAPRTVVVKGDSLCGDSVPGCLTWLIKLNSRAYYDGAYAWGSRSRRGYTGDDDCSFRANGGSWSDRTCNWGMDPSPTALYAQAFGTVSAWGGIASKEHYLHRHYNKDGGSWLVSN